jgi:hypothetical protein
MVKTRRKLRAVLITLVAAFAAIGGATAFVVGTSAPAAPATTAVTAAYDCRDAATLYQVYVSMGDYATANAIFGMWDENCMPDPGTFWAQ